MLWEVEITAKGPDSELRRVYEEFRFLNHSQSAIDDVILSTSRGFLLEGALTEAHVQRLATELLVDPVVEDATVHALGQTTNSNDEYYWTVLRKPGVMDPVSQSVLQAGKYMQISLDSVQTFRRYRVAASGIPTHTEPALRKLLANDAIEQIISGRLLPEFFQTSREYHFQKVVVPLRSLNDTELEKLSRVGQLALNLAEMKTIQAYFQKLDRDPTDIELETLAQTWSEHCSHKTLKGTIEFNGRRINNLLKETIFGATQEIRQRLGDDDWCVSVFEDNAGVVKFTDDFHACFKVETHNHPSAIEPYGGANTGIGGVIRDPLGTGLGAKPVCNTDVFCFSPPELADGETLPPGVLHPSRVMTGVVSGVRDYGNRMGIPTVNGAVLFDKRYLGNPLVYCGTVGLIPSDAAHKEVKAGDLIVAIGGRTGRDGIHGATFSSIELTSESEEISGGAVQIGNAITEKKVMDVVLQARDRKLYHAITDCGAGGFSSAVGEMGEKLGAQVHLDRAPLKYEGLSYTEIWISEAQERMVLAVPPDHWNELQQLCASEDVEATVLGEFVDSGKLELFYQSQLVGDLTMEFLHDGRPNIIRQAVWAEPSHTQESNTSIGNEDYNDTLKKILGSYNVCSKEWIIRQYDHEVQSGSVLKPLVGCDQDGPGDAAVIAPVLGNMTGLAIGCGICPQYGDSDPYAMAAAAIDEAVRNVVAVGADPQRIALLDNFCWGNTDRPEVLGSLVCAAEACRDISLAWNMPFISGKDSLKNEFHSGDTHIVIPPTLLISAMGRVPNVQKSVSMDLKKAGNSLFLIGATSNEMGCSHYNLVHDHHGGSVPKVNAEMALTIFKTMHESIQQGWIRSCHDLSEGGLAVAVAEMAFAGMVGAEIDNLQSNGPTLPVEALLFSESTSRFVVEVEDSKQSQLIAYLQSQKIPFTKIGLTTKEKDLRIRVQDSRNWLINQPLGELKEAWQSPLRR